MKKAFVIAIVLLYVLIMPGLHIAAADMSEYAGEWACVYIDEGDGVKKTEYEGTSVSDLFKIQFNEDGSLLVNSFGQQILGTWQESSGEIKADIEGEEVLFLYEGGELINTSNGITMYLENAKATQPSGLLSLLKGSKYTGTWVASTMDEGDGILKTEMDGMSISQLLTVTINRDGSAVVTSMGVGTPGTWKEIAGVISVEAGGQTTLMLLVGNQMKVEENGVIVYFDRAQQGTPTAPPVKTSLYAGTWVAVRYESMGNSLDIKMLFPDGGILTLKEDGTGEAHITKDYTEKITWVEKDGALFISGSYVLSAPVYDAQKGELAVFYGSSAITVVFQKAGDETPRPAVTPKHLEIPEILSASTPEPTPEPTAEPTEEPQITEAPQTTESPTAVPEGNSGESNLTLFSARYPAPKWTENTGYGYDSETYNSAKFELKDGNGSVLASVAISASIEDVSSYRDKIKLLTGYAQKAGKSTLDEVTICGIMFSGTSYERWGWNYTEYAARLPESRASLFIELDQPENMKDDMQGILDSLVFAIPEMTPPNIDPPMPEDGAPYQPKTSSAALGNKEITATWIPVSKPIILDSVFNNQIALIGESLYALAGNMLYVYTFKDGVLTPDLMFQDGIMQLEDEHEYLSTDKDGKLYVSEGIFTVMTLQEGKEPKEQDLSGKLVMHPDGLWGITFWSNADPKLVRADSGKLTAEPWVLSNLSDSEKRQGRFNSISSLSITNERIYVAGSDAMMNDAQRVAVFDLDGNELFDFGGKDWSDEDSFGSVTGIAETPSGILVQDGNNRVFKLFSLEGVFIGSVDCDDLLGTNYPWLSSMISSPDGLLVAASQERVDESADELLIFKLTGL